MKRLPFFLLFALLPLGINAQYTDANGNTVKPPLYPVPLNCPTLPFKPSLTVQYAHSQSSSNDITVVVAHRGNWESVSNPENTVEAMSAAANDCVEAVEIDLRLTSDREPVPIHDWFIQKATTGTGNIYQIKAVDYQKLNQRDRYGNALDYPVEGPNYILNGLNGIGSLTLVFDCKDSLSMPGGPFPTSYDVLKAMWAVLVPADAQHNYSLRPRIIFKARMSELPEDPAQILKDLNTVVPGSIPSSCASPYYSSCTKLNIVPIWYSSDTISSTQIKNYLALGNTGTPGGDSSTFSFLWFPEAAVPYPNAPLQQYLPGGANGPKNGSNVTSFLPSNDWPEGTTHGGGNCCRLRNTSPTAGTNAAYTGDPSYLFAQGINWYNTDKVFDTMSFLQAQRKRNVCRLAGNCNQ